MNKKNIEVQQRVKFDAYFIIPKGKIIDVKFKHINEILDHPRIFGYKKKDILALFQKYHEKIGFEGKAREVIIRGLIDKGWIRIRRKINFWIVQLAEYNDLNKSFLRKLAKRLIKEGLDPFSEVKIESYNEMTTTTFGELL